MATQGLSRAKPGGPSSLEDEWRRIIGRTRPFEAVICGDGGRRCRGGGGGGDENNPTTRPPTIRLGSPNSEWTDSGVTAGGGSGRSGVVHDGRVSTSRRRFSGDWGYGGSAGSVSFSSPPNFFLSSLLADRASGGDPCKAGRPDKWRFAVATMGRDKGGSRGVGAGRVVRVSVG